MVVEVVLLGTFRVRVDGNEVPDDRWGRRHAALLVKLLALSPDGRLHREQVIDALWPDDSPDQAAPKLHKAAHFARKATGVDEAVVLRGETVALFPGHDLTVDVARFEELARKAAETGAPDVVAQALAVHGGLLLPQDLYEPFTDGPRERLRLLHLDLLRRAERWEDVLAEDPADEEAHLALMRRHADAGDRHAALRQFERMDRALRRELGVQPGPEAVRLRDALLAQEVDATGPAGTAGEPGERPSGRDRELAEVEAAMAACRSGRGSTVVVTAPPGMGKTALLRWCRRRAIADGWRVGYGVASAIEGAWPYAPVMEALADLCRRHPALLDGLDDRYRSEIERSMAGEPLDWSGDSSHQRLFVAVAELVRLAAAGPGVLLLLDDVHDSDEASLRLVHYLARSCLHDRVGIVMAHRTGALPPSLAEVVQSLLTRQAAVRVELGPLPGDELRRMLAEQVPGLDARAVDEIVAASGGVPFTALELARRSGRDPVAGRGHDVFVAGVDRTTREVLQRVAVIGTASDTDEFVALSGLDDDAAFHCLDDALAARLVEHTPAGYQFRHTLIREALLADLPPHRHRVIHREAAERLAALGGSPARVGHHLLAAGDHVAAVPAVLRAAETSAAVGAYRDALDLLDSVKEQATGKIRGRLLAVRADVLAALGDVGAPLAYREAIDAAAPPQRRLLRAKLARASLRAGDPATAEAVLDDLTLDGGPHDGEILLAKGYLAYFKGDLDMAWSIATEAKQHVLRGDQSWQMLDLVALQGLLAHNRGEWMDTLRVELRRAVDRPDIAANVFDGYLCPAEYMLYGPTPYDQVIELARNLRSTAERSGAMRAVAFGAALIGEAALLCGDLELAAKELEQAVELHHDIESRAGEAHSLQRLAEVRLAQGDAEGARALLERAIQPARWSPIAMHLLQRIFGTLVRAAPDPQAARAVVDRAESVLVQEDFCLFCDVMFAVPAAIACAQVGDLDAAQHYLGVAELSAPNWDGTAWQAALHEARAHVARAKGDHEAAHSHMARAVELFASAGQPLDSARCAQQLG